MKILYTSTVCVSAEESATAGQILPILGKPEDYFKARDDSAFAKSIKEKVWGDISHR